MIFCSVDQALKTSGWAIFEDNNFLTSGTFETKATDPIEKRLGNIWSNLDDLRDAYNVEYLFFEDIQRQTNVETFKKLAYVQAAVLLWCYWKEVPYTILGPSHWRSILKNKYGISFGRKREEQKVAAQNFIKDKLSLSLGQDECDAVCIGLAGIQELRQSRSAF